MQPGMGQLLGPDDVHNLSNPFGEQNLLYNIAVRKDRYEQLTAPLFGNGNGSKDAPVFDLGSESLEGFREKIRLLHQLWESSGEKEFLLQSICCDVQNFFFSAAEQAACLSHSAGIDKRRRRLPIILIKSPIQIRLTFARKFQHACKSLRKIFRLLHSVIQFRQPFRRTVFDLGSESLEGFREKIRLLHQLWESSGEKEFLLQSICCDVQNFFFSAAEQAACLSHSAGIDKRRRRLPIILIKSPIQIRLTFARKFQHACKSLRKIFRLLHSVIQFIQPVRSTEEKILDIAYICGYENLSYFNRQFRARYGQTPKEYRSQKRFFE